MKKNRRLSVLIVTAIVFFIIQACNITGHEGGGPTSAVSSITEARTYTGTVTGSFVAHYRLPTLQVGQETEVDCPDPAAVYKLTIAPDATIPAGSRITSGMSQGSRYFRLDAIAVVQLLDKGRCLERDPSEDRTDLILEGGVNPKTGEFNVLNCDVYDSPNSVDMNVTGNRVDGVIVCPLTKPVEGEASTTSVFTFTFSNLVLK